MTDELREKFEAWFRRSNYFGGHEESTWCAWQAAYASRDAEVEALKRDAERYRWLRARMSVHRHQAMPDRYGLDEYFLSEGIDELNDDQYLDTAIDAAIRESQS